MFSSRVILSLFQHISCSCLSKIIVVSPSRFTVKPFNHHLICFFFFARNQTGKQENEAHDRKETDKGREYKQKNIFFVLFRHLNKIVACYSENECECNTANHLHCGMSSRKHFESTLFCRSLLRLSR